VSNERSKKFWKVDYSARLCDLLSLYELLAIASAGICHITSRQNLFFSTGKKKGL
jgi:hypothetical protein